MFATILSCGVSRFTDVDSSASDGQWSRELWGDHVYNSNSNNNNFAEQVEEERFGPLTVGLLGGAALLSKALNFHHRPAAATCITNPTSLGCPANCATAAFGCNIIPRNCVLMPTAIGCPLVCRVNTQDPSCNIAVRNCMLEPTDAACPPICAANPLHISCRIPIP